ncbi:MAG: hypothetical protein ACI9HX_001477, partial [Pseudoalteromonas tetraodonis]
PFLCCRLCTYRPAKLILIKGRQEKAPKQALIQNWSCGYGAIGETAHVLAILSVH